MEMKPKPRVDSLPDILTRPFQGGMFRGRSLWDRLFITEKGCWQIENNSTQPYLQLTFQTHRVLAHRLFYELLQEPIPEGLQLDHLCRNTQCVNPDHLEPVTSQVNVLRGEGPSAQNARKKRCLYGHNLPKEGNSSDGGRNCTTCLDQKRQTIRWFNANRDEAMTIIETWEKDQ